MMAAAGGWAAPVVEMTRFLVELSGRGPRRFLSPAMLEQMTAPPPPPQRTKPGGGDFGLGWDRAVAGPEGPTFSKGGDLSGLHTLIEHTAGGVDWALFVNASTAGPEPPQGEDAPPMWAELLRRVREAIRATDDWPDVDLFPQFP